MATESPAKQIPPPDPPGTLGLGLGLGLGKRGALFRGFGLGFAIPLRPFSEVLAEQSSDKKLVCKILTSYDPMPYCSN